MQNIEFFDLFPSLSRSNEVFFGKDNVLPKTIEKHVVLLKTEIEKATEKDYRNKQWLINITKMLDTMGHDVAKIINAERVVFCLVPVNEVNASALNIHVRNDLIEYGGKDNKTKSLNLDRIADLEDILITKEGYKFRSAKGKILMFNLFTGLFIKCEVDSIVGIILHELGHQFQDGVFGVYKDVADTYLSMLIQRQMFDRVKTLSNCSNPFIQKLASLPIFKHLFKYIVVITFKPSLIPFPLRDVMTRLAFKLGFKKQLEKPQYKMKGILDEWDKGNKPNDSGFNEITDALINYSGNGGSGTRNEYIKEKQKEYADEFKKYKADPDSEEAKTGNAIYNFFKSIVMDIKFTKLNVLNVLTLSKYNVNQYNKLSFTKKYEFFADIFATSYGYGPQLWRGLANDEKEAMERLHKYGKIGINRIPMCDAIFKYAAYKRLRYIYDGDEHGSINDRAKNMYTALVKELETNTDLNSEQRKAIKADIELLKKADEQYYEDSKISGFWYKSYNKLIDERIKGTEFSTEEEILKPIIQVCQESINEEMLKVKK